ncbi:cupin-like domain-containing protein [Dyella mobilis]|uniref:Cupin-like domain-containing protein n=1 Tax=Dyella mobilis TaxID=1849582 RepID=A0ABS2KB14_9GAMM|nr:cupin-like domain-containing protein [Dyella mobilis]MBM7128149.1 cupin-like domain-containing protein [Dyella mobilis]GLQ99967.1 cupin [Dyella mobilis]
MPTPIEEFQGSLSSITIDDFAGRDRPLVIRGLARDWPLVVLARQSDAAFARRLGELDNGTPVDTLVMPPSEDGVVGYNADLSGFNYRHHRVPITQGLQRLAQYSREHSAEGLAIQSAAISTCAPGFSAEHRLPFMGAQIEPRMWIGNKVVTPAHFDEYYNIACVVCGRRKFTLFAPEQVRNLYVGPLDFAPTGSAISMARLDRPEDPRFPRLKDALAAAYDGVLEPGDAIYIPPLWWHHVASLERLNALVNYWWKPVMDGVPATRSAMGFLMHGLLSVRSLSPAEKNAWRSLLDYYLFGDEDPAAHIPDEKRGVLAALTPELAEKLKQIVLRQL